MNVLGKDFDAHITFAAILLKKIYKVSNFASFSLKIIGLFCLKYKAELDPGHVPTS